MSLDKGVHWHGRHTAPMNNPRWASVDKWRASLDRQKPLLDRLGIEVINCTEHSRLSAYPRMDIFEALALPAPVLPAPD